MIECVATERVEVEYVATPAVSVPAPSVVVPSLNVTVPVGVSEPGATTLTVAVNVKDWPKAEGLPLETNAVVVELIPTTCESVEEVLAVSLVSPP